MIYLLVCLVIGCVLAAYLAVEQLILWVPRLWGRIFPPDAACGSSGCCTECGGGGASGDPAVPGGGCWDCRGTGHPHQTALPGAAEGGSTYQHHDDDWFDERDPRPYG